MGRVLLCFGILGYVHLALAAPTIDSEDDYRFDFDADFDARIMTGSSDAYRGYGQLYANGWYFTASGDEHEDTPDERGFSTVPVTLGNFEVTRTAWVPAEGGNWARYVDTFTNTSDIALDLNVSYQGYLGSVELTSTVATSSGDTYIDWTDTWAITDDADASVDPSLGHVVAGEGAAYLPNNFYVSVSQWDWGSTLLYWSYEPIPVEPDETVSIMWFAIQEVDRETAQSAIDEIAAMIGQAHAELGPEGDVVANWNFDNLPKATVEGPDAIPEGGSGHFTGFGSDPERRALVMEWDIDGDGTYELLDDEADWSADGVDGPDSGYVKFRVSNDLPQYDTEIFAVNVSNVAPSVPDLIAPPDGALRRGPSIELATTQAIDIPDDDVAYRLEIHGNADYTDLIRIVPILAGAVSEDGNIRVDVDLPEGAYYWRLRANDEDGGVSEWMTASFTLDDDAPIEEDAGPPDAGGDSDTDSDTDTGSDSDTVSMSDTETETESDTDTGSESDTDTHTGIDDPVTPKDEGGCGCTAAPSAPTAGAMLLLFALLLVRRRSIRTSEVPNA